MSVILCSKYLMTVSALLKYWLFPIQPEGTDGREGYSLIQIKSKRLLASNFHSSPFIIYFLFSLSILLIEKAAMILALHVEATDNEGCTLCLRLFERTKLIWACFSSVVSEIEKPETPSLLMSISTRDIAFISMLKHLSSNLHWTEFSSGEISSELTKYS